MKVLFTKKKKKKQIEEEPFVVSESCRARVEIGVKIALGKRGRGYKNG